MTPFPPTPTTSPTPAPGQFAVGVYVLVINTGGEGLNIHAEPSINAKVLFSGNDAEVFLITDGPVDAEGFTWWRLSRLLRCNSHRMGCAELYIGHPVTLNIFEETNMKPLSITANREKKEFSVIWDDNHVSLYPFSLLRAGCPCAECRGGHDKMGDTPDPSIFTMELPDSPATRIINCPASWFVRHYPGLGGRTRRRDLQVGILAGIMSMWRMS